jgi:hypothetical protein
MFIQIFIYNKIVEIFKCNKLKFKKIDTRSPQMNVLIHDSSLKISKYSIRILFKTLLCHI